MGRNQQEKHRRRLRPKSKKHKQKKPACPRATPDHYNRNQKNNYRGGIPRETPTRSKTLSHEVITLSQGVDIGHRGSAIRRQSVTEGVRPWQPQGEGDLSNGGSKVPAEGVDCSCNRATGRNQKVCEEG